MQTEYLQFMAFYHFFFWNTNTDHAACSDCHMFIRTIQAHSRGNVNKAFRTKGNSPNLWYKAMHWHQHSTPKHTITTKKLQEFTQICKLNDTWKSLRCVVFGLGLSVKPHLNSEPPITRSRSLTIQRYRKPTHYPVPDQLQQCTRGVFLEQMQTCTACLREVN